MQEMKVDDVDKVLDEINDQNDQLQQINTAMQTPIGDAANMDEDELARELEVTTPLLHAMVIGTSGVNMVAQFSWSGLDHVKVNLNYWQIVSTMNCVTSQLCRQDAFSAHILGRDSCPDLHLHMAFT